MRLKWLKWAFGIAAVLVVVLIVAVYVIISSYDFNRLKPRITEAARDATGRELALGGDIDLEIGLTPALVVEDVGFQNAPWGSRPEMAGIGRFEVQVALFPLISGNVEIKRLILVEPDILIETSRTGKSNLKFEVPKKAPPPEDEKPAEGEVKLPPLAFNEVIVKKGRLRYRDGRTGKAYELTLERLTAYAAGMDSPVELKLKGAYNKEPFEVKGILGPIAAFINPDKDWPLDLKAGAAGATLTVDGTIKNALAQRGIDIGFTADVEDFKGIEELSGVTLPVNGPLQVSGRAADPAPKAYKVSELKIALAGSDVGGSMEVNLAGKRPRLKADLKSRRLDLRPILPEDEGKKEALPAGQRKTEKGLSRRPLAS
jgi:uncharacterized protein involved in outer membrane biogenesis